MQTSFWHSDYLFSHWYSLFLILLFYNYDSFILHFDSEFDIRVWSSPEPILLQGPRIDNGSDAISLLHCFKRTVNLSKGFTVCDKLVNLESSTHVVADKSRQLRAALDATESAALPDTASDQLER